MACCLTPEAELKLPQLQRDLPISLQKEGAQGLLPLPAPYHSSGPTVNPGQATQQADVANDSKFIPTIHFSHYSNIILYSERVLHVVFILIMN